jgi:FdrA protein
VRGDAVKLSGIYAGLKNHQRGILIMDVKKINELFKTDLVVINMGLGLFAENLRREKVRVLQMDWKPPAGGNKKLVSLLAKLGR